MSVIIALAALALLMLAAYRGYSVILFAPIAGSPPLVTVKFVAGDQTLAQAPVRLRSGPAPRLSVREACRTSQPQAHHPPPNHEKLQANF